MSAAARVGDPIEHTSALEGLLLGLAVGAAAVVVAAAAGRYWRGRLVVGGRWRADWQSVLLHQ
jgi:hypothetical protein